MFKTIWDTVQLIWNDSVLSKIIADIIRLWIIPICVAIGGAIYFCFRGWFRIIGQWLASEAIIPKWSSIAFPVLTAAIAWIASGIMQVQPRDESIAYLREQVEERDKAISGWRDACNPEDASSYYSKLKGYLKECQDSHKEWKHALEECQGSNKQWKNTLEECTKTGSVLLETVKSYESNCSIIQEYRDLDNRKIQIDNWRNENRFEERTYETLKSQSDGLQARIIVLHNKLKCEPQ